MQLAVDVSVGPALSGLDGAAGAAAADAAHAVAALAVLVPEPAADLVRTLSANFVSAIVGDDAILASPVDGSIVGLAAGNAFAR